MRPASVSGIVTEKLAGQLLVNFFSLSLVTFPDVFANVDWAQFPSRAVFLILCSCKIEYVQSP